MASLDGKKAFHALRKVYFAAQRLHSLGKGIPPQAGEYGFFWDEQEFVSGIQQKQPKRWSFEVSRRLSGQSLWDGHIEEYHLHDVVGAQYKNYKDKESYRYLQWETRIKKSDHEYYLSELLQWASNISDRS